MKRNLKLILFISAQLAVVLTIIMVVLFAGKKTYTVTFDLNGGTHIDGNLVQTVRYGQSATPPAVVRDGAYLAGWSAPYDQVTKDIIVYAVWEYQTSFGIEFEIIENSNYCLISGCYENISGDIYIGSYYQGKRVLGIKDDAFKNRKNITGVYLLDGIISIGNNAFYGCDNLKNIVIPATVETIGKNILKGCNKLEKISVSFIGNSVYDNTNKYFGYLFGATNYTNAYQSVPSSLKEVTLTRSYYIPAFSFFRCSNIEKISVTGYIVDIGNNAFRDCTSLKSINLPKTVSNLDFNAFTNCISLTEMILPESLIELEDATFANCTSLEKVVINSKLEKISLNAFQNCDKIEIFDISLNNMFFKENGKIFVKVEESNVEYIFDMEKYTDDVDLIEDNKIPFPGLIIGPIKGDKLEKEDLPSIDIDNNKNIEDELIDFDKYKDIEDELIDFDDKLNK